MTSIALSGPGSRRNSRFPCSRGTRSGKAWQPCLLRNPVSPRVRHVMANTGESRARSLLSTRKPQPERRLCIPGYSPCGERGSPNAVTREIAFAKAWQFPLDDPAKALAISFLRDALQPMRRSCLLEILLSICCRMTSPTTMCIAERCASRNGSGTPSDWHTAAYRDADHPQARVKRSHRRSMRPSSYTPRTVSVQSTRGTSSKDSGDKFALAGGMFAASQRFCRLPGIAAS